MRRKGTKKGEGDKAPPHLSELNEAARREPPVSVDLEFEVRSILVVHPVECIFAILKVIICLRTLFRKPNGMGNGLICEVLGTKTMRPGSCGSVSESRTMTAG